MLSDNIQLCYQNTSNVRSLLAHYHTEKPWSQSEQLATSKVPQPGHRTLKGAFQAPIPPHYVRTQEITRCIIEYTAKDLRPLSVVDNDGFQGQSTTFCQLHSVAS